MSALSPSSPLPLLGPRDLDAPLAWLKGRPRSARAFLADVQIAAQAQISAQASAVVNLCGDRYEFAVLWAAALVRGLPTLMPPNALPATLDLLARDYPQLVCVERQTTWADDAAAAAITQVPDIAGDQTAAVLLTSGSTGTPVPHARSWRSVVLNAQAQALRVAEVMQRPTLDGLTLVATVPAQHSYGFESSVTLALLGGAAMDAGRPFYPADVADALGRVPRPRVLVTTPFHLKTLLAADIALPAVDAMVSATAPLSPQLAAQAERALLGPLFEVYGCTEAGQVATRHTTASPTWTTYGDLRITPRLDAAGEESFWVQGGHVFEPTVLADVLELDSQQHFRLLGRRGDLIHVAGKRSSLAHLNHHLNSIAGVEDGAFWMPEEDGEGGVVRPVAFVVAPTLTQAQVQQALQDKLDAVFVPRRIVMLAAIAHEGTGKVIASTLRQLAFKHGLLKSVVVPWQIPTEHPALAGHFPGQPIMPGVMLVAQALESAAAQVDPAWTRGAVSIASAKFLAPLMPGDVCRIELWPGTADASGATRLRFDIRRGDLLAATGQLALCL